MIQIKTCGACNYVKHIAGKTYCEGWETGLSTVDGQPVRCGECVKHDNRAGCAEEAYEQTEYGISDLPAHKQADYAERMYDAADMARKERRENG